MNSEYYHDDCENLGLEVIQNCLINENIGAEILQIEYKNIESIDMNSIINKILKHNPSILGMPIYYNNLKISAEIAELLKKENENIHIVLGGSLVTQAPLEVMKFSKFFDLGIIGEGEVTFTELVKYIERGNSLEKCAGIVWRNGEELVINEYRKCINELDAFTSKCRDMLTNTHLKIARINTSRGCKGKCTFCTESRSFCKSDELSSWRGKSPTVVVDEIEHIKSRYKINNYVIIDNSYEDSVNNGKERIAEISKQLIERDLNIYYKVLFRAESFSNEDKDLLNLLKKSGLINVFLGVESGCEDTLKLFGKRARLKDILTSINLFGELGIPTSVGFIMFHPYSTLKEARTNLSFIKKINKGDRFYIYTSRLMLFHGAPLLEKISKDGLLSSDFSITNPFGYIIEDENARWLANEMSKLETHFNKIKEIHKIRTYCDYIEQIVTKMEIKSMYFQDQKILKDLSNNVRLKFSNIYYDIFDVAIRMAEESKNSNDLMKYINCSIDLNLLQRELKNLKIGIFRTIKNNKDLTEKLGII